MNGIPLWVIVICTLALPISLIAGVLIGSPTVVVVAFLCWRTNPLILIKHEPLRIKWRRLP